MQVLAETSANHQESKNVTSSQSLKIGFIASIYSLCSREESYEDISQKYQISDCLKGK